MASSAQFGARRVQLSLKLRILHQPQSQDGAELLACGDVAAEMHAADQAILGIVRRARHGFMKLIQ
jgi:hypothetical protein